MVGVFRIAQLLEVHNYGNWRTSWIDFVEKTRVLWIRDPIAEVILRRTTGKPVMVRQQPKQEKGGGQDTTTAAASSTAMTYKPQKAEPAWWQQTSTDVSSDHEDI